MRMKQHTSPENLLLVLLTKPLGLSETKTDIETLLKDRINWEIFLREARRHRLSGKINHHPLNSFMTMPENIKSELSRDEQSYREIAEKNHQELLMISDQLSRSGIQAVLLRSWIKDNIIYGEPGISCNEIPQLLVKQECLQQVESCLQEMGFEYGEYSERESLFRSLTSWELVARPVRPYGPDIYRSETYYTGEKSFKSLMYRLNLCVTDWRIGLFDLRSIVDRSVPHSDLGNGLKIPQLEDLVLFFAYEFYHNCGLKNLAYLRTGRGALKFLSDFSAGLHMYLKNQGDWKHLIKRARIIQAESFLYYTLYHLQNIYGTEIVPNEALNWLNPQRAIEVPVLVNTTVSVPCKSDFLRAVIQTAKGNIGSNYWLIAPDDAYRWIAEEALSWKKQGNSLTAGCKQLNGTLMKSHLPKDDAWEQAGILSINPKNVDPRQFFRTHISDGFLPDGENVQALVKLLWDEQFLYVRAEVRTDDIFYLSPDFIHLLGEQVILYFCDPEDPYHQVKTVGLIVRDKGCALPKETKSTEEAQEQLKRLGFARVVTHSNEYCLDFSVSWQELGIQPNVGKKIDFDVEIIHSGSTGGTKTVLAWSGSQRMSASCYGVLGTITLL